MKTKSAVCHQCKAPLRDGAKRCTSCGAWTWQEHIQKATGYTTWEEVGEKPLQRISLGILDHVLCGGVVKSDTVLIAGGPGAGKSTLLLDMCRYFCALGKCLYIASEEDAPTIKARGDRLGFKPPPGKMIFLNAMGGDCDIGLALAEIRPVGFIVDSTYGLVSGDINEEVRVLEIIKKFSVQLQAPALLISQVNSELEFSGLKAKQHAVDVLLELSTDESVRPDGGQPLRVLESNRKNRNGRTGLETFLKMTETGLKELSKKERAKLDLLSDSE